MITSINKNLFLSLICLISCLILALPAWSMNVETARGPAPTHPGKDACYRLWHDGGGWHLRWSSKVRHHNFSGRIWSPEGIVNLGRRVKTEANDNIYVKGNGINFQAGTRGGEDGFDFSWDGPGLWLDITIDGKALLHNVMVGPAGIHPANMPFIINRPRHRGPPPRGAWVPGHYGPRGNWIPGHFR